MPVHESLVVENKVSTISTVASNVEKDSENDIQYQIKGEFVANGFEELHLKDNWNLVRGGKYVLEHHGSTIFAFTVGEEFKGEDGFRIAASHGDFPGFRIKPNAGMENGGYLQLNMN